MHNYDVEKTIVVPDSGGNSGSNNFLAGVLASACQQRGLDANAVLALCNRNGGAFGNGGLEGLIGLIIVAAIFGGNGNGLFGGNNNNSTERQMLMDAFQRNGVDISQLASTLNCSVQQVQAAINNVATQVCNIGNQVGMTGQQVINAIQQGNMSLTQQICNCCCDLRSEIKDQTINLQQYLNNVNNSVDRGFAQLGYATRDQTCTIEKAIQASTEQVLAGQRAAEMREMQREISERDRKISEQAVALNNCQQSAAFAQMIGQAVAPLNAGVAALQSEIAGIKCHLPETKVIPCGDNYVKVNTGFNIPLQVSPAAYGCYGAFGGYPYGYGYGCSNNGGWG